MLMLPFIDTRESFQTSNRPKAYMQKSEKRHLASKHWLNSHLVGRQFIDDYIRQQAKAEQLEQASHAG
jgi:hypothetical protein